MKFPKIKLRVFHQGLILVGIPLLIELLLIGNLSLLLIQSDKEHVRENRYRHFSAVAAKLMALTYEELSLLLVSMHSRSPTFLKNFHKYREEIKVLQKDGMKTAENDPLLEDQQAEINESIDQLMSMMDHVAELVQSGSALQLLTEIPAMESNMQSAKGIALDRIDVMRRIGQRVTLESMKKIQKVRDLQAFILWTGLCLNLLAGALLLVFYRRNIMDRLGIISSNTLLLSQGQQLLKPVGGDDEIAQLDSAFHSMEEKLQAALERERALFNNASDVICVLDATNRFVRINPACHRLWNYDQDTLLNENLFEIIESSDVKSAREKLADAQTSAQTESIELRINSRSRGTVETSWSVYWSQSESSMYCVVQDITERKQIDKAKQQFLSMISSDLRRPLAQISQAVGKLVISDPDELPLPAAEKLQLAQKNVGRLLALVNDLLQIAEMESGRLEISKEQSSLNELLKRSTQDVEALAQKNNVKVEILAEELSAFIDPNRVIQVLVNLLSNAIKFSPPGASVTLAATREGDVIECSVIDRGRGVPASHREAIFEKFQQVEAVDGKRKAGTGLGLPICKQIIEEHGGTIGVSSEEGKGSKFWFRIPIDESASMRIKAIKLHELEARTTKNISAEQHKSESGSESADAFPAEIEKPSNPLTGRLTLMQKGILLIGVPIVFDLVFVGSISNLLMQTDRARQNELKQRNIAFETTQLMDSYLKTALIINGPRTDATWLAFQQSRTDIKSSREKLKKLVKGDRVARKHFKSVDAVNDRAETFFEGLEEKLGANVGKQFSATVHKRHMLPLISVMSRRLQALIADAEKQEFDPADKARLRESQAILLLAGLGTSVLASILLALFFSKDMSARLATLADNAERFSKEQSLNQIIAGKDEIANLDRVFHQTAKALDNAHKKERAVLDNSKDLICALSTDGKFTSVNPACIDTFAITQDELMEKTIFDLLDDTDKAAVQSALLDRRQPDAHASFETRTIKKDGTPLYISWTASFDSSGDNIYCVAHDITARKELEGLKQEFLSMVSHDLRTPLGSITGIAKLIAANAFGKPGVSAQTELKHISEEGDKLLELINDILDIEKLEAGKMQLVPEDCDLSQLIEGSLALTTQQNRKLIEVEQQQSVMISADKDRLQQAISNILTFACKLRQPDLDDKVRIRTMVRDSSILIEIESPGVPLTQTEMQSIFDRFGNSAKEPHKPISSDDQNSKTGSAGLALPLAKRIIENHEGRVEMNSTPNSNTFVLTIPNGLSSATINSSNAVSNLVPDS